MTEGVRAHGDGALAGRGLLIIPAFNEEDRVGRLLESLTDCNLPCEVVVVDDGSHDRTAEICNAAGVRVVRHPFNLGYGAALQTGYKLALRNNVTWVAQMDADGQHDPRQIEPLLQPLKDDDADLVIGSRFVTASEYQMGFFKNLGRRFFRMVARSCGLQLTDPTSGFQAMNARVLELYCQDSFPADYPDVDILLLAHRLGIRIIELPVTMERSPRASTLHSGLTPVFYLYKMLLSIWAGTGSQPSTSILDDQGGGYRD